jgi:hypothetical protein
MQDISGCFVKIKQQKNDIFVRAKKQEVFDSAWLCHLPTQLLDRAIIPCLHYEEWH